MSSDERVSKRLDRAWFGDSQTDPVFDMLETVSKGAPVAIGLVVDGTVVRGVLGEADHLAESATTALRRSLDVVGTAWDESTREYVATTFLRQRERADENQREARELTDRYFAKRDSPTLDDIELADVPDFVRTLRRSPTVVVRQAQIQSGTDVLSVSTMSVRRTAISSWWFLDDEEGQEVIYK